MYSITNTIEYLTAVETTLTGKFVEENEQHRKLICYIVQLFPCKLQYCEVFCYIFVTGDRDGLRGFHISSWRVDASSVSSNYNFSVPYTFKQRHNEHLCNYYHYRSFIDDFGGSTGGDCENELF